MPAPLFEAAKQKQRDGDLEFASRRTFRVGHSPKLFLSLAGGGLSVLFVFVLVFGFGV